MTEMDASIPRVTLVIPIRNEETHIERCLRAVQAQTYPHDALEIIVVDGESADRTPDVVRDAMALDHRIRLLSNPSRTMAHGLNVGIRAATGEFVGVVSGHSAPAADYVRQCVDAMERTGASSVGGRIVREAHGEMHRAISIATASPIGVGDSRHNYARRAGWVDTVFPGFWRRDLFDNLGAFDPVMIANEDNEFSYRIRKAGGRIWYDPSIEVEYVPRSTLQGLFAQYRRYAYGKMRVLRKHRGGLRWRHFAPAVWLAFVVVGAVVGLFLPLILWLWLAGVALYLLIVVIGGMRMGGRGAPWWQVSLAVITLHIAYGVGTWQGLASWFSHTE